jgi:hypothetical protein
VNGLEDCGPIALAVDESGGYHIAVDCRRTADSSEVRYATSPDGLTWTTTRFAPPANRLEMDSQIAFDGSMLYVAYSRLAPIEGGCGDRGLEDVGVYVRSRQLPNGAWSAPRQIGLSRDELQAFRVANGRIYATVWNDASLKTSFETLPVGGGTATRVPLASTFINTSLRVGDDGIARVALDGAQAIRFGTVDASGLHASVIPSTARGHHPNLVLAPGNVAYMLWTRIDLYGGCAGPEPPPDNGTFFSTNAGGSWHTERVSSSIGEKSLTVEPGTGIVHAVVAAEDGFVLYDRAADGTWTHETLASLGRLSSPVIRQDATSGRLIVAYVQVTFDESTPDRVEIITKG